MGSPSAGLRHNPRAAERISSTVLISIAASGSNFLGSRDIFRDDDNAAASTTRPLGRRAPVARSADEWRPRFHCYEYPEPFPWEIGNTSRPARIALSAFCYRRRKTLTPQGSRKLPKLDVAGSTPVARSLPTA